MAPKGGEPSLAADSRRRPAAWIVGWLRAAEGNRSAASNAWLDSRAVAGFLRDGRGRLIVAVFSVAKFGEVFHALS